MNMIIAYMYEYNNYYAAAGAPRGGKSIYYTCIYIYIYIYIERERDILYIDTYKYIYTYIYIYYIYREV